MSLTDIRQTYNNDSINNTLAITILQKLSLLDNYKFQMFLGLDPTKGGFLQKAMGYKSLLDSLESVMQSALMADALYVEDLKHEGVETLTPPQIDNYHNCFSFIEKCDIKLGLISRRFYRYGLAPKVPVSMIIISRSQKYEKFRDRIKAQAVKYVDMYGEELIEKVRDLRAKREAKLAGQKATEKDYSEIYRDFLKTNENNIEELDEDVSSFIEEQ